MVMMAEVWHPSCLVKIANVMITNKLAVVIEMYNNDGKCNDNQSRQQLQWRPKIVH